MLVVFFLKNIKIKNIKYQLKCYQAAYFDQHQTGVDSRCQHLLFFFLTALGLHCCAQVFSGCCEEGLLFLAMCGLLSEVAPLVVEHRLCLRLQ